MGNRVTIEFYRGENCSFFFLFEIFVCDNVTNIKEIKKFPIICTKKKIVRNCEGEFKGFQVIDVNNK